MLRKSDLVFIGFAAAVVGTFVYLSRTGEERFISRIEPHVRIHALKDKAEADAQCFACHDPDKPAADSPPMPPKRLPPGVAPPTTVDQAGKGGPRPKQHPERTKNCRLCHRLAPPPKG
jgi:hypothetical protein